jgi:cathepsin L
MKAVLAIVFALALVSAYNVEREYLDAFEDYKIQYAKSYVSAAEEVYRYNVFKQNLDFVNNWDAEAKGFQVGINSFADLTVEEFASIYNGFNMTGAMQQKRNYVDIEVNQVLADDVDWRKQGAVTAVKNQGQCGSCWSFSATGSMEAAHFFATKDLVSLSEQNLVDCSVAEGNQGCQGGWMDSAFKYVITNHGIDTEASYRYTATGPNACKYSAANIGATIASFTDIPRGNEAALQAAVAQRPVSVAIDAGHSSFQLYKSGVYYEPACSSTNLDHGVLAIGYGTDGSSDYWIVKNSWGTSWGMEGYINMSRNRNNNCGIATVASFPVA